MPTLPPKVQELFDSLPKGLRDHINRVRIIAVELAGIHGADVARTDLAAACHDLARAFKEESLIEETERSGIDVGLPERRLPILLHGPIAATWLERELGITDPDIIQAVRWHSTARAGLSTIAKIVFLADKIDPHKVEKRPELAEIALLARENLDKALLAFIDAELVSYIRAGGVIHPATIEARDELLEKQDCR